MISMIKSVYNHFESSFKFYLTNKNFSQNTPDSLFIPGRNFNYPLGLNLDWKARQLYNKIDFSILN